MEVDKIGNINWKKVGGWATVLVVSMVAYYSLSAYRTYVQIKKLKNEQ